MTPRGDVPRDDDASARLCRFRDCDADGAWTFDPTGKVYCESHAYVMVRPADTHERDTHPPVSGESGVDLLEEVWDYVCELEKFYGAQVAIRSYLNWPAFEPGLGDRVRAFIAKHGSAGVTTTIATVVEPDQATDEIPCPVCRGTGGGPDRALACVTCGGDGMLPVADLREFDTSPGSAPTRRKDQS